LKSFEKIFDVVRYIVVEIIILSENRVCFESVKNGVFGGFEKVRFFEIFEENRKKMKNSEKRYI
jgi:uncharacterized membrane protein SirB2